MPRSVQKSKTSGKVETASTVYEISAVENDGGWRLFPTESRSNFCYVVVDPGRRVCRLLYHAHCPYW